MALSTHTGFDGLESARLALELVLLGPGAGVAVGLLALGALELVRRRTGVRRDYESLYSLGVAFAAYAAAEAMHGSGFIAAFCAGLTIAALDVELCDCFLEYGQTTAEMTLLFTFILFGSSLIWQGLLVLNGTTLLFAVVVVLIRPVAFFLSLFCTNLDSRSRLLIAWFGPRGLSSLLLILVPVFAGGARKPTVVRDLLSCRTAISRASRQLLDVARSRGAAGSLHRRRSIPSRNSELRWGRITAGSTRHGKPSHLDGRVSRVKIRRCSGTDRGRPRGHELQLQ